MRYVIARFNQYQREEAYRIYITDSLKVYLGLNTRYADLFAPEETRTADEIIGGIKDKLRQLGGE
jgi:hypothetical protein